MRFDNKNLVFDKLSPWTENTDANVKYFSGTATYENSFNLKAKGKGAYIIWELHGKNHSDWILQAA